MTLALTIAGLYLVILLRAGATYALGRGGAAGARRARLRSKIGETRLAHAEGFVDRWGALAVLGSFFTIGVQTVINFTAGLLRMPLRAYLPALAVGGLVWASIYGTLGGLSIAGLATLWTAHPFLAIILLAVIVAAVTVMTARARRTRTHTGSAGGLSSDGELWKSPEGTPRD